jgi:hypothetical protein
MQGPRQQKQQDTGLKVSSGMHWAVIVKPLAASAAFTLAKRGLADSKPWFGSP